MKQKVEMAEITLLTPEQIAAREQKPKGRSGRKRSAERTQIIEEYKSIMRAATPGYGADVVLEPSEDKRVVRQNLKTAADELNQDVEFRPIKDGRRIHLRFITPEEKAAKPKRTGRPRKNVQGALPEQPAVNSSEETNVPKTRTRKPRSTPS